MEDKFKKDREEIIKKFHEFKKDGRQFNLGDLMTDDQKKRFKDNQNSNSDTKVNPSKEDKEHARKTISAYISKISKFINEIEIVDSYSFTFYLNGKDHFIGYDFDSDCVVYNYGKKLGEKPREIGLYEIEDILKK